jgi:hypothetical protein
LCGGTTVRGGTVQSFRGNRGSITKAGASLGLLAHRNRRAEIQRGAGLLPLRSFRATPTKSRQPQAQIAAAIEQIDKAARLQSRSCETSSQVGGRLEKLAAETTRQRMPRWCRSVQLSNSYDRNRTPIRQLADSIKASQASSSALFESVSSLADLARNVEKDVDTIVVISFRQHACGDRLWEHRGCARWESSGEGYFRRFQWT